MKTTLEIPDALFRKAKSRAAERGQTLKDYVTEALQARLSREIPSESAGEPPWMTGFGALKRLHKETARIQALIDEAFEAVQPEDRL